MGTLYAICRVKKIKSLTALKAHAGHVARTRETPNAAKALTPLNRVVRLCYSRMPFVRAYPRESQEMVFDADDKAFAFFGGACARGIYDYVPRHVIVILCPERLCALRGISFCD